MSNVLVYLEQKKKILIEQVNCYNKRISEDFQYDKRISEDFQFKMCADNLDIEKTFTTPSICKNCGICCESFPGVFSPNDFLNLYDLDYMRNILNTGAICIARSASQKFLVLRPRGIGDEDCIVSSSIDYVKGGGYNPCVFNTYNEGCILPVEYRPCECLLHYALGDNRHKTMYNISDIEKDYEQYQEVLEILAREYYKKEIPVEWWKTKEKAKIFIKSLVGCNE